MCVCSCVETGGDQQWAGSGCESDVVLKMATELCLDGCEDSYMESWSDAARSLVQSVEGWEWVWSVVEKSSLPWSEFFHKPAAMLEDIYLTALVAAVYGLVSGWTCRCLWVWFLYSCYNNTLQIWALKLLPTLLRYGHSNSYHTPQIWALKLLPTLLRYGHSNSYPHSSDMGTLLSWLLYSQFSLLEMVILESVLTIY